MCIDVWLYQSINIWLYLRIYVCIYRLEYMYVSEYKNKSSSSSIIYSRKNVPYDNIHIYKSFLALRQMAAMLLFQFMYYYFSLQVQIDDSSSLQKTTFEIFVSSLHSLHPPPASPPITGKQKIYDNIVFFYLWKIIHYSIIYILFRITQFLYSVPLAIIFIFAFTVLVSDNTVSDRYHITCFPCLHFKDQ